ncbi:hypothetical protein OG21DRAFT_1040194 [Imleria badia]|nr:hypothetical protein OG21DRAFT_1040194 [Imleria badia]
MRVQSCLQRSVCSGVCSTGGYKYKPPSRYEPNSLSTRLLFISLSLYPPPMDPSANILDPFHHELGGFSL